MDWVLSIEELWLMHESWVKPTDVKDKPRWVVPDKE